MPPSMCLKMYTSICIRLFISLMQNLSINELTLRRHKFN